MNAKVTHQPMVIQRLRLTGLLELARRNRFVGLFHFIIFGLSLFLSPLRYDHISWSFLLFACLTVVVVLRTIWCHPKIQEKTIHGPWFPVFATLSTLVFVCWSVWLCLSIHLVGLGHSTYFCCLLLAGICAGAVMTYSPSRTLMNVVILVTHVPSIIMLASLDMREAHVMSFLFMTNVAFLMSMGKQASDQYFSAIFNKEMADRNTHILEGVLYSMPGMISCVDLELNPILNSSPQLNRYIPLFVPKFIESNRGNDQFEYLMELQGGPRWMMVFLSRYDDNGEGRILVAAYDVHASKMAEEELNRQRSISMESAKLATLGEMSAGIAHEINNPLSVMIGRTDMMMAQLRKDTVPKETMLSNLEKILKASDRIAKIVKGLKTFSRNGNEDEFRTEHVENMIEDVLDFSREKFKYKNIDLKITIEAGLKMECRSTQIEQVFLNLLSNAYDAIVETPQPWIKIEGRSDGDGVIISVTDSGQGIPTEVASKIMQPFYTTKEIGKGTGLGLSISLGIITAHHGDFFYDTAHPNTRFVIKLPKFHQEMHAAAGA